VREITERERARAALCVCGCWTRLFPVESCGDEGHAGVDQGVENVEARLLGRRWRGG